ncbi:choice-of-anchor Q domain-containing protein [Dokdonella sp. MW10]|uniref:choice-of-anchor Q domain-containing protein n=1 Tax=Dokdonella sp. MW10 TaxID=2992926 RepID=UPI003F811A0A
MRHLILLATGVLAATPCLADNTFVVNTTSDVGGGSLRVAIQQMQPNNGIQTIRFELPANAQITLTSALPPLVGQTIVIDGSPSPGLRIEGAGWSMLRFASGNSGQSVRLQSLNLRGGSNADGGGCVDLTTQGYLQVIDSTFDSCFNSGPPATGAGGGAIRTNGTLRLTRSRFTNNASSDGGSIGLVNAGGAVRVAGPLANSVLIERTQFIGNRTHATQNGTACNGGQGGALSLSLPASASAAILDTQFIDNATLCPATGSRQAGTGGAVVVYGEGLGSNVSFERVTFRGNEARTAGSISVESARLNVVNGTFFENTGLATADLYLLTRTGRPPTTLYLRNSTFARGTSTFASNGAYLHLQNGATATEVRNTVFARPLAGPACSPSTINVQSGDIAFTGENSCYFFRPDNSTFTSYFPNAPFNTFGLDAMTQSWGSVPTLHPAADSVLIDNGTNTGCPTLDARGLPRPINGGQATSCDVGAVEVNRDRIFGTGFDP